MQLYPAIDIKGGKCVRLVQGDMHTATVFNDNPQTQAKQFAQAGVQWLHIVDLDGAFKGKSVNITAIKSIVEAVQVKVQLGGGIRTLQDIEMWLEQGVQRVILGTSAVSNSDLVRDACREFDGHIAVGIDARGEHVAVQGWAKNTNISMVDLAKKVEDFGVSTIVYTDIERDGILAGANVARTALLARSVSVPIIASGGVKSVEDIFALKTAGRDIAGVIVGRALYGGSVSIKDALRACGA